MSVKKDNKTRGQKGSILFMSIIIMIILISIALGLATALVYQISIMRSIGDSVIAFYAADTGMEKALLYRNTPQPVTGRLPDNDSTYDVGVFSPTQEDCLGNGNFCPADNFCLCSSGVFKGVRRAIETQY